ncbi:hypothetical protein EMCRGX_G013192 [Ephydatia muelleri]
MRRHCIRLRLLYSLTHSLHVLVKVAYCHNKELRRLAKLHALSWFHGLAGLQQLGGLPLVKPTMEGLKRMLAKPKVQKEPVMANILKAMVEATGPEPPLSDVRLLAVWLVAFAGFLHCNELIKLKCYDITFNAEGIVINVQSRGAIAAANAGVQDTLFKRHGCWKSESAKDGYGKDSAQRWLEFSKDLGI